jgi:hypothetical protein
VFTVDGKREVARTIWRGPNDDQEHIANNRLIAAAPELLEALVRCLDSMTIAHPSGLPVQQGTLCEEQAWDADVRAARAAIAKAKGEAR